jgi:hypothetical protein
MAVQTKGRRKIVVDGQRYIWHVTTSDDPGGRVYWSYEVRIISEDRGLYIVYPLNPYKPTRISEYEGIYQPAQDEPPFVYVSDRRTN